MLRNKIIRFKKIYKFYFDHFLFLKGDRALSKLINLLISNKKEFNHFFKSRSSDIVLLKLGNLHQNAKRYEALDENVRAKRADFFSMTFSSETNIYISKGKKRLKKYFKVQLNKLLRKTVFLGHQNFFEVNKYVPAKRYQTQISVLPTFFSDPPRFYKIINLPKCLLLKFPKFQLDI